jgi:hypothetical protein
MALTDIHAQEGDGQDFSLEIGAGTLNTPNDILVEENGTMLLTESSPPPFTGNIFIMSE